MASETMTEQQARTLYQKGEEAVVSVLLELTNKNSGNSSQPPSSDGLKKPPLPVMSQRKKTGRKPGGQKGRKGSTLEQSATPDITHQHRPDTCAHCVASLQGAEIVGMTKRQVFEIPLPKIEVIEHQGQTLRCACCGKETKGAFPEGVEQPVQYGPNLLGYGVWLHTKHLLPFARCAQILKVGSNIPFSPGTLQNALSRAFDCLAGFERVAKETLADVSLKHVDETGGRVAGKLHWFHVRCTPNLAYLFVHPRRGGEAVADLADYKGILVSDFWSSYVKLSCGHVFCGAHLLRELDYLGVVLKLNWASRMKKLLERAVSDCHRARERGSPTLWNRSKLSSRFEDLVEEGLRKASIGKARALLRRLSAWGNEYLAFLYDLSLPFTNNEAERDLRMFKVKLKIAGCFRTIQGATLYCRLRSYILTCGKQGLDELACCRSIFLGDLIMPAFRNA
jgi:transposase